MKVYFNRVEWGDDCYVYWFDYIYKHEHRLLGYEHIGTANMLCFWWFCIIWKLS
jgi:hypothetical protein